VLDPGEPQASDFRGLLLLLRGRAGLSQRELASLAGVSERAIRTWEAGESYPGPDRLKALISLYIRRGTFTSGREREEAGNLWDAARRQAPRLNTPFDHPWFAELVAIKAAEATPSGPALGAPVAVLPVASRGQDWGEAPDVGAFHGRALELETLTHWVLTDESRLLVLLGMGGLGKTTLAAQLAHDVAPRFDSV
jgi:transcriptional regulator with XRE-family HTH domain